MSEAATLHQLNTLCVCVCVCVSILTSGLKNENLQQSEQSFRKGWSPASGWKHDPLTEEEEEEALTEL